ncbi:hypothetical protein K490DRAFT_58902 [Saccharata proteae CBS 121410]|uniref:Uncharacterized protein n=1 Tax=Saccharata proteae CBS 121410 TaxID=1314787 RepID=A0A9P4LVG0_9PEZI|nr:hypothetical protein K490DRAFT_58902 [Saccharata proteae CBS 121410]
MFMLERLSRWLEKVKVGVLSGLPLPTPTCTVSSSRHHHGKTRISIQPPPVQLMKRLWWNPRQVRQSETVPAVPPRAHVCCILEDGDESGIAGGVWLSSNGLAVDRLSTLDALSAPAGLCAAATRRARLGCLGGFSPSPMARRHVVQGQGDGVRDGVTGSAIRQSRRAGTVTVRLRAAESLSLGVRSLSLDLESLAECRRRQNMYLEWRVRVRVRVVVVEEGQDVANTYPRSSSIIIPAYSSVHSPLSIDWSAEIIPAHLPKEALLRAVPAYA